MGQIHWRRWLLACGVSLLCGVANAGWAQLADSRAAAETRGHGLVLRNPTQVTPARIEAGATLTARVSLTLALTPPPGVQQRAALRDWSATLDADAHALTPGLAHRYFLEVTNVRPVDGASLVYRASLVVPAWVAPGRYALTIEGPSGVDTVVDAVEVIQPKVTHVGGGAAVLMAVGAQRWRGEAVRWFVATVPGSTTQRPALVAWSRPAELARGVENVPTPWTLRVIADAPPRAGTEVSLSAIGAPDAAQVAWNLSDGTTAFGPARITPRIERSGLLSGAATAIGPDGQAATTAFEFQVAPGRALGCHLAHVGASGRFGWFVPLILLAGLLKRRPR